MKISVTGVTTLSELVHRLVRVFLPECVSSLIQWLVGAHFGSSVVVPNKFTLYIYVFLANRLNYASKCFSQLNQRARLCHFLQNNQEGQHKPGGWVAPRIMIWYSHYFRGKTYVHIGDSQCRMDPNPFSLWRLDRNWIFCSIMNFAESAWINFFLFLSYM